MARPKAACTLQEGRTTFRPWRSGRDRPREHLQERHWTGSGSLRRPWCQRLCRRTGPCSWVQATRQGEPAWDRGPRSGPASTTAFARMSRFSCLGVTPQQVACGGSLGRGSIRRVLGCSTAAQLLIDLVVVQGALHWRVGGDHVCDPHKEAGAIPPQPDAALDLATDFLSRAR